MIKKLPYIFLILAMFIAAPAFAQTTTSSPYSQFGLGDLKAAILPQQEAMGGISAGFRRPDGYNQINFSNPGSYSAIRLTSIDIGLSAGAKQLKRNNNVNGDVNGSFNHIVFGIPVTKSSALAFGLVPFTESGYNFTDSTRLNNVRTNYVYGGDGGLAKAFFGYGIHLGKAISIGANASYIFGNIRKTRSTEFPDDPVALNSRLIDNENVRGLSLDYGVQVITNPAARNKFIIGYSGNSGRSLKARTDMLATRYTKDFATGNESSAVDTTYSENGTQRTLDMPLMHRFGFALERQNEWLIGADVTYSGWSGFASNGVGAQLRNSYGIALGGQYTPDVTAVGNYWSLIDYRFGVKYDKTYININGRDIKQMGLTFGLGLPLQSARSSFYKVNISAEVGQRGTLQNNLVRERFFNLKLGFLLNDQWFVKPKFD